MKVIGEFSSEGFTSVVREDDNGRVFFRADADIDADGANGQNGAKAAYRSDNKGSEHLANGGLAIWNGRVVFAHQWARAIFIDDGGRPLVLSSGVIPSKTAYVYPGKSERDPSAYVDSEIIPYIVVPAPIINGVKGIVMGCKARVTFNELSVNAVVADKGPLRKVGEVSIAAARAVGIPSSPRAGGIDDARVLYELWPGVPAVVNGQTFKLIPA